MTKQSSGEISRENAKACLHLHTRCHRPRRRAIQYAETPVIETRGRGVLDSLPSRGMTSVTWRTQRRLTLRHCERSDLSAEAFGEGGSNPESFRGGILDCFVARAPRNDEEESASATLSRAPDAAQRPPGDAKHRPVRRCAAEPGPINLRRTMSPWVPALRRNAPRCSLSGTRAMCIASRGAAADSLPVCRLSSRADVLCLPKDLRLWIVILARYPRKEARVFPVTIVLPVQHPHRI
ncbi:hypothetical protein ACVWYQ_001142 [Bradyrhizobium sp. USDA 3397]